MSELVERFMRILKDSIIDYAGRLIGGFEHNMTDSDWADYVDETQFYNMYGHSVSLSDLRDPRRLHELLQDSVSPNDFHIIYDHDQIDRLIDRDKIERDMLEGNGKAYERLVTLLERDNFFDKELRNQNNITVFIINKGHEYIIGSTYSQGNDELYTKRNVFDAVIKADSIREDQLFQPVDDYTDPYDRDDTLDWEIKRFTLNYIRSLSPINHEYHQSRTVEEAYNIRNRFIVILDESNTSSTTFDRYEEDMKKFIDLQRQTINKSDIELFTQQYFDRFKVYHYESRFEDRFEDALGYI